MRLIDADALPKYTGYALSADEVAMAVENAPTIDPVRHGRWVESFKVNAPPTLRSRWTCSWCGNVQTYGITDYCPNCGARMDGESDDE